MQEMLDKMFAYNRALETHGYVSNGAGVKPWSLRWTLGTSHVDVRNTEWTAFSEDSELCVGTDPDSLRKYLTGGGI